MVQLIISIDSLDLCKFWADEMIADNHRIYCSDAHTLFNAWLTECWRGNVIDKYEYTQFQKDIVQIDRMSTILLDFNSIPK